MASIRMSRGILNKIIISNNLVAVTQIHHAGMFFYTIYHTQYNSIWSVYNINIHKI